MEAGTRRRNDSDEHGKRYLDKMEACSLAAVLAPAITRIPLIHQVNHSGPK